MYDMRRMMTWLLALALLVSLPSAAAEGVELPVSEVELPLEELGAVELGEDALFEPDELVEAAPEEWMGELALPSVDAEAQPEGEAEAEEDVLTEAQSNGLVLSAESLRLGVKETYTFAVKLNGAAAKSPKFKSSDTKVASVTSKGKVTAKKAGRCTVTVTVGSESAQCAVEVLPAPEKVTLNITKATLGTGETLALSASVAPADAVTTITWKSSKTSVASVSGSGVVKALAKGSATITAKASNGKKATCKLTVKQAPTGISIAVSQVTLAVGQTYAPEVKVAGGGSSDYTLSVSGDAVTVSGAKITAVAEGEAVVTAATYNGFSKELRVTVGPAPKRMAFAEGTYGVAVKGTLTLEPEMDVPVRAGMTFKTSDAKVAAVTDQGVVTGKKAGTATITATAYNGLRATCKVEVYKAPSKVTLSKKTLNLNTGDTYTLEAALPANTRSRLTWTSSNTSVATVSDGKLTAKGKGTAKITVTTENKKSASCTVKVTVPPTKLTLSDANIFITKGSTATVSWTLDGEAEVTPVIANKSIASITKTTGTKLTIKGLAAGTTTLRVATPGGLSAEAALTVLPVPTYVRLERTAVTLAVGQTYQIDAETDADPQPLTYKSSKTSVATVSASGLVTAVKTGTANITVKTSNNKSAKLKVTVVKASEALTLSPASLTLGVGDSQTLTVAPKGTKVTFTSDDTSVVAVNSAGVARGLRGGEAVITAVAADGRIAACRVTVTEALAISPASLTLIVGDAQTLTIAPADVKVNYSSSNASVASVTAAGVVRGLRGGEAVITATAQDGRTAACRVTVLEPLVIQPSSLTLTVGETGALATTPTGTRVDYTSSDANVASVSSSGVVQGRRAGEAVITAVSQDGRSATCNVIVREPLAVIPAELTLGVGEFQTLATTPAGVRVRYASSDAGVASVTDAGVVRGLRGGEAVITVTADDGRTATCRVTVLEPLTLRPDSVTLAVGEIQTLTVTPAGTRVSYASSDAGVASVSDAGVVRGLRGGEAVITATAADGRTAACRVTVEAPAEPLTLSPASLTLKVGDTYALTAAPEGIAVSFRSGNTSVASVSGGGRVTALREGQAVITATASNGETATCRVTVEASASIPVAPGSLRVKVVSATELSASWSAVDGADGYCVYVGSTSRAADAALYGTYGRAVTEAQLLNMAPGSIVHVFVTAFNGAGETAISGAAHALARTPAQFSAYAVSLAYSGTIMMAKGNARTLTAAVSPSGYDGALTWTSGSSAVAVQGQGLTCRVDARSAGTAQVSVTLENGASASVLVRVVDASDTSDANFVSVQKALLENDTLMNEDEGGNVIWDMIAARLIDSNLKADRVETIVDKLKAAGTLFKELYVYSMGTYGIVGEATRDKRGSTLGMSQFILKDDTLYLTRSSSNDEDYAYTMLHESGHAIDYNAGGAKELASEADSAATEAVRQDVRQLLMDRMYGACAEAGVSLSNIDADKVVDAVLNYKALLNKDSVMASLTADERRVYEYVTGLLADDMNATLPMNNGTMVWDAVEGATNFAVSGNYGHAYLLDSPQYKELAKYYYYDSKGNATITAEPFAEFFSANVMQDAATLAVNLAYLPRTCQYFSEVLAPKLLEGFKSLILSK